VAKTETIMLQISLNVAILEKKDGAKFSHIV
jgi:hypothetical protein